MAKDTVKAFVAMQKKEAAGVKMASKPCKKPPGKGRK